MEEQKTGKGICARVNILTGGRYNIHPSEAFQGIEEGVIEVTGIYTPSEEDIPEELKEAIRVWSDVCVAEANELTWIEYRYLFREDKEYFPVEAFVNHTTIY